MPNVIIFESYPQQILNFLVDFKLPWILNFLGGFLAPANNRSVGQSISNTLALSSTSDSRVLML